MCVCLSVDVRVGRYVRDRHREDEEWKQSLELNQERLLSFYSQQALRQCQAEVTKVTNRLQALEMQRPMVLLFGLLGTLVYLCMTGVVVFFGWVEAVVHPLWVLVRHIGEGMRRHRAHMKSGLAEGSTPIAEASPHPPSDDEPEEKEAGD